MWDVINNLIDKIGNLIDGLLDLGTTIFNAFYDGLSKLLEGIVDLIIPNDSELQKTRDTVTQFNDTFDEKFNGITQPIKSFENVYSSGSSNLYNFTFEIAGYKINVLPSVFKTYIDSFRLVANGLVVIWTFLHIYISTRKEITS